jgi:hypothetical protein
VLQDKGYALAAAKLERDFEADLQSPEVQACFKLAFTRPNHTVRARRRRPSARRVSHRDSISCGAFVWARKGAQQPKTADSDAPGQCGVELPWAAGDVDAASTAATAALLPRKARLCSVATIFGVAAAGLTVLGRAAIPPHPAPFFAGNPYMYE